MRKLSFLTLLAVVALPCFAADSPWNGSWKLNQEKSHLTGRTITFTQTGNMYTLAEGAIKVQFACDGKEYPVVADRTISCTQSGNVYTTVHKAAGTVLATTAHEMSPDGNTITEITTGTRPDGTTFTDKSTSQRVGRGKGLAGTWKETMVKSNVPDTMVLRVEGDTLHMEDPAYKDVSDTKLDGTPGAVTGGNTPPGLMYSTTAQGPNKVLGTVTLDGKDMGRQEMTLSADGKTLTDVHWAPGKESEKTTYVYEKQ